MRKETIKVAYNANEAGFILSKAAISRMKDLGYLGKFSSAGIVRHHPALIQCIEELGRAACGSIKASGPVSDLRIAEVEGLRYYVVDHGGNERVIGMEDLTDASAKSKDGLFLESFPADKVFFTADTHFGHEAIIHYSARPFESAEEMDAELIRRWNETVPEDGIVFHLGDFAHGPASRWCEILQQLNGSIHLVAGNHDVYSAKEKGLKNFSSVREQRIIDIDGQKIYLNHYPFLCYGGAYDGVWQLFGHVHSGPFSHSGLDHPRLGMLYPGQYDVGVDNNDFRPISFEEVKKKIARQMKMASKDADSTTTRASGAPIVFLDVDGVLVTKATSREPDNEPSLQLDRLLRESGAEIVVTGGWAAFKTDDLKAGPLSTFSSRLAGVTPRAQSHKEAVAAWLMAAGSKHRYVVLSATPTDDTRAVLVDPAVGLTLENVEKALRILK